MKLSLKIPPLALGIISALLIWLIDRKMPLYQAEFVCQNIMAGVISCAGLIVSLAGILAFKKRKTTIDPRYPAKANKLVINGIYKYSRNPMYLGMLLAIVGFVIFLGSLPGILIIILFVIFITRYQIQPEEIALQNKFGDVYIDYTKHVRRWL